MRYQAIVTRERGSSSRRTGRHSKYSIKDFERLKKKNTRRGNEGVGKGKGYDAEESPSYAVPC